jgi:hypothetical protein
MSATRRQRAARWIVLYELNDGPKTKAQITKALADRYDAAEIQMGLTTAKRRGHIHKVKQPGSNCSTPWVWTLTAAGEQFRDDLERKVWEADLEAIGDDRG